MWSVSCHVSWLCAFQRQLSAAVRRGCRDCARAATSCHRSFGSLSGQPFPALTRSRVVSVVTDAHACTLRCCLPILRQIEQPSEEDAASLTAALLAVEGAVLADEVLASQLAARRTRFHSGAQLLQVRAILVLSYVKCWQRRAARFRARRARRCVSARAEGLHRCRAAARGAAYEPTADGSSRHSRRRLARTDPSPFRRGSRCGPTCHTLALVPRLHSRPLQHSVDAQTIRISKPVRCAKRAARVFAFARHCVCIGIRCECLLA